VGNLKKKGHEKGVEGRGKRGKGTGKGGGGSVTWVLKDIILQSEQTTLKGKGEIVKVSIKNKEIRPKTTVKTWISREGGGRG